MKYLCSILMIAIGASFAPSLAASNGGSGASSGSSGASNGADPGPGPSQNDKKIKPGEKGGNGDTHVANMNTSGHKCVSISPADGGPNAATTIRAESSVECIITGVDGNDIVNLGSNGMATVTCTGGTINMAGGGTTLTVHVSSGTGSEVARVNLAGGGTVLIAPGSSVVIVS